MIDGLLDEVRKEQDALLEKTDARHEVARRLQTRDPRAVARGPSRALLFAAAAALMLTTGSLVAWSMRSKAALSYRTATDGMQSEDGFVFSRSHAELHFSDGSGVRLAADSAMRVVELRENGAALLLERGSLDASVRHRADTHWRVYAGPYSVLVTGTHFRVQWDNARAELSVHVSEGGVRVVGSCMQGERRVSAGQDVQLSCNQVATHRETVPLPATVENHAPPTDLSSQGARSATPSSTQGSTTASSISSAASGSASRIDEAERASLAGDIQGARTILLSVHERDANSNEGAFAAFLLGRLAFDSQHDFAEAARWFAAYETARPEGALIREAMGRHLEALVRLRDEEAARSQATRYLARFPDGPHAAMAREHLE